MSDHQGALEQRPNSTLPGMSRLRAYLPQLAIGIAVAVLFLAAGLELKHHIDAIEQTIADLGPYGVLAFIGLFALGASLLVPDTILCVSAGVLFGLAWGAVAVAVGSLVGATAQYLLARRFLHGPIQRMLARKPSLLTIERVVQRDQLRLQVLLRLTPLNPATISYLLGAAGVRFPGFLVTSLGQLPALFLEVYLGHAAKHLARVAGGDSHIHLLSDLALFGGLGVGLVVMFLVSRSARRAVQVAIAEENAASHPQAD
jgi:uncharacterized membrane protein YdjX (TVP38/TMEM64 family)